MIRIALTGSIGMGKSTTAGLFAEEGVAVWDADAAVHRLYGPGAAGTQAIARLCPGAVTADGVDRARLRAAILADQGLLRQIEAAIHPLVAADRRAFLRAAEEDGIDVALCDIPLLFETSGADAFDHVVVVSAPADVQRARVLARPGMTAEAFDAILAKQMPDAEKRARANTVIDSSKGLEHAHKQVRDCLARLRGTPDA